MLSTLFLLAPQSLDSVPKDLHGRPLYAADRYFLKLKSEAEARVVYVEAGLNVSTAIRVQAKRGGMVMCLGCAYCLSHWGCCEGPSETALASLCMTRGPRSYPHQPTPSNMRIPRCRCGVC